MFEFAINVVRYSEELDTKRKFSVANQIIRSGTSIGTNVKESYLSSKNLIDQLTEI